MRGGRLRRQKLDLAGFKATKLGAPSPLRDVYYSIMEMSWAGFVMLVTAVFVLINLAYGAIYACLPGAIGGMAPGSLADGFFFSVETLGTVGYGNMAPATLLGHGIATVEILTGLFFSATITGLIFARFARPRDSFVFSRVAVVGRFEGRSALMVRVASIRVRPLADVNAQIAWLEHTDLADGGFMRRLVELPLARAHNPLLALSWTLVHFLEPESAVMAAFGGSGRFQLTVTVNGIDTLLASQSTGARAYRREDILPDHEFVDVIADDGDGVVFDLSRLHDTRVVKAGGERSSPANVGPDLLSPYDLT